MTTPRQRRHANTKQAILQTALQLVAEKGVDKLSLREIARRVEYSPAGLYEYFGSKEEILRELARKVDGRLNTSMQNIATTLPPVERLTEICLAYIQFALRNNEYFTLMNSLPSQRTSLDEPVPQESAYVTVLQAVQTAINAGSISARDGYGPEEITYSLWSMIHGMAMLRLTHLRYFQADYETINRQALQIFMAGLQSSGE